MGKNSLGVDCRRGHLSYSLFQDIKIVGKSLTGICQFIFPMFYGVLPNNIGYIFYGDKRNFLAICERKIQIRTGKTELERIDGRYRRNDR